MSSIAEPRTGLEGKFSVRFATAIALATGRTDETAFTDSTVTNPDLIAVRDRVQVVTSARFRQTAARVTVHGRDGRTWQASHDVATPRWTASPAEQWARLEAKFIALAGPVLGQQRAEALRNLLREPDTPPSAAELAELAASVEL
jgi:2-methylcitrate dehydratase PrpD